jgi:hypothetical protein
MGNFHSGKMTIVISRLFAHIVKYSHLSIADAQFMIRIKS